MYKKIFALALALSMLLAFSACGSVSPKANTAEPAQGSASPEAEATPEPTAAEEPEFAFGSISDGVYTSDFLGIGCTLDESWTYYSDEEIEELNGIVIDATEGSDIGDELAEALKNSTVIYDMYAMADDGLVTMNICYENLGLLYSTMLTTSEYVDVAMANLGDTLTSAGYSDVSCEKISVDFCGEARDGISITGVISGLTVHEKLVCIKRGDYVAVITLASFGDDITDSLAALFYSL